ncbi:hypothetical protein ACEQ8H_003565 [Pleosporales sp. CAS-2024a]
MAASPRKRVTRASFHQTWDHTDTASLDPSALPVARIPRAWERQPDTKRTGEGREKKIWRRVNLRSRAADTPHEEESDEPEHDAPSRAVKRQQQLSPKAMETTAAKLNGSKRVFRATRWDRRKSVLPRKKSVATQHATPDDTNEAGESDDAQDATSDDVSYDSLARAHPNTDAGGRTAQILPEEQDRRSTLSFAAKQSSVCPPQDEQIAYPQLPQSDSEAPQEEAIHEVEPESELADLPLTDDRGRDTESAKAEQAEEEEMVTAPEASCLETEHEEAAVPTPSDHDNCASIVQTGSPAASTAVLQGAHGDITYPDLPQGSSPRVEVGTPLVSQEVPHELTEEEMDGPNLVVDQTMDSDDSIDIDMDEDLALDNDANASADEQFTEASLQLDIQRDYKEAVQQGWILDVEFTKDKFDEKDIHQQGVGEIVAFEQVSNNHSEVTSKASARNPTDITDGLTLSFTPAKTPSAEPAPRRLHSPPPPPVQSAVDDATMTIALDDDTALLKDFISRAAASKAERAAVMTHRRESLQNRRDSDIIRHALSSPRKALEDKDPNSPSKYDNELTLDLSQDLTLSMDKNNLASPTRRAAEDEEAAEAKSHGSRRSSRAKKSRLPAPASAAPIQPQTSKIAIRRPDGTEHVVLKKSDAQELSLLTRANTRKNKQGAFGVTVRLMKLAADAASLGPLDDSTREIIVGKNIRWDPQLTYYQENPETIAEAESIATPDELSMPGPVSAPSVKPKSKVSKNSTPKIRRVRGLGTANGTPAKALLAPLSFDDEDKDTLQPTVPTATATSHQLPRPKASKMKKMTIASAPTTMPDTKLPALEITPVGIAPTQERKSRLAAPKKVMFPPAPPALPAEGKENTQRIGLVGATPKKGIPVPKVIVPHTVGMESGLPRRRGGRKI